MISSGPYPGLRPYEREESSIFFGREELCDELLDKLSVTRFLPIVGPSGCGKSSLVRAGMLADLRIGYMPGSKDYWKVAEMRPGDRPFKNLADSLQKKSALGPENKISIDKLRSGLGEFIDAMEEVGFPENTNLLLLVDQFEEIFRYRSGGTSNRSDIIESSRDEADAFVSLLLALSEQQVLPIYVVITMRTDFIGDCAKFNRLPEAINRGLFLVPRLTKLQLQRAIVEPARVFDCEVEDALVNRLLKDVGTDPDDLPLMQHVLMRIYNQAEDKKLTYQKYLDVGGFETALSEHANEAYSQLTEEQKPIAEKLFRCLSTREIDHGRDTRRPTKLGEIAEVCIREPAKDREKKKVQLKKILEDLTDIVDVFRQPRYSFITPSVSNKKKLESDTILDISHESLIRQWRPTLEEWIKAETKSASDYFQLEKNARRWEKAGKKTKWLEPMPQLQISLDWKEREDPTPAWAERYKFYDKEEKNFDLALEFLEESEKAFNRKKRAKYALIVFIIIIINATAAIIFVDRMYLKSLKKSEKFLLQMEYDEAIKHGNNALFWNDDLSDVYITVGMALFYKNNHPKAIIIFEKGIKISPNDYKLHEYIGNAYLKSGKEKEAVRHYEKAIKLSPPYDSVDKEIINIVINSKLKSQNYQKAIDLDPNMVPLFVFDKFIKSLINEGKNAEADKYKQIKEKVKESAPSRIFNELFNSGRNFYEKGEDELAIRLIKIAIESAPENVNASVYTTLGYALLKTGKEEEAIENFEKAISKDPEGVEPGDYTTLGGALLKQGKEKEAFEYYEKAIEIAPKNFKANIYTTLGYALLKTGEEDEAIKYFKMAIEIAPEEAKANDYTALGYALLKTQKEDEAIEYFETAISEDPEGVKAIDYKTVGSALLKQGNDDEAAVHFKKALNLVKKHPIQSGELDVDTIRTDIERRLRKRGEKESYIKKYLKNVGFKTKNF